MKAMACTVAEVALEPPLVNNTQASGHLWACPICKESTMSHEVYFCTFHCNFPHTEAL